MRIVLFLILLLRFFSVFSTEKEEDISYYYSESLECMIYEDQYQKKCEPKIIKLKEGSLEACKIGSKDLNIYCLCRDVYKKALDHYYREESGLKSFELTEFEPIEPSMQKFNIGVKIPVDYSDEAFELKCPNPLPFEANIEDEQDRIADFLNVHNKEAKDICTKKVFDFDKGESFFEDPDDYIIKFKVAEIMDNCNGSDIYLQKIRIYTEEGDFYLPGSMFDDVCPITTFEHQEKYIKLYEDVYNEPYVSYFYSNKAREEALIKQRKHYSIEMSYNSFDQFCEKDGFEVQYYEFKDW